MLADATEAGRPERPRAAWLYPGAEDLLSRLRVNVAAFTLDEFEPGTAPPPPATDQIRVLYVVRGEGSLEWAGGSQSLEVGTIAVVPGGFPVQVEVAGSLIVASSYLSATAGHGLGFFENLEQPLIADARDPLLASIFGGLLMELETSGIGSKCIVESLMKQVLIVLLRRTLARDDAVTPLYLTIASPGLTLVINTIQTGHGGRLSLPGLAKMVGMTAFGLTREFERVFGETLLEYIQGVRLYQATTLLVQTDLPIKSIAASVGFASRSHFSRAFSKRQGEDPTSFRKTNSSAAAKADAEDPTEPATLSLVLAT